MAPVTEDSSLIRSISQLVDIPAETMRDMVDEIQEADLSYQTVYTDLHSGGWHTVSLYAPGKTDADGILRDGCAKPTALVARLPATDAFLNRLGVNFFAARLACNDRGSWIWEHRDYLELRADRKRVRLHVPIVSNPDAVMQFAQWKVHLAPGWLWKLNPTDRHGISNTGEGARVHLIIDCYENETLSRLLDREMLEPRYAERLPQLDSETRRELMARAREMFTRDGGGPSAEEFLLQSFHRFDLGDETSYDLLVDLYRNMGIEAREKYWNMERIARVYERAKLDDEKD